MLCEAKLPFLLFFPFIFYPETTIWEKREKWKEKSEENKKKRQSSVENCRFFLAMAYKKDIFAVFAYEFELLQKMKSLLTQGWNQLKLMKSSALPQMKLNPPTAAAISFERSENFTLRSNISPTRKGGFSWKRQIPIGICRFLSMGYEKDIFAVFAYEFELLQKMKSLLTQGWNQLKLMKSSALPQMKLNPPIRRRGGFHPTKLDFIVEYDFTHPQGWI